MYAGFSAAGNSWVNVNTHPTIADAINTFHCNRACKFLRPISQIKRFDFREIDYIQPNQPVLLWARKNWYITKEAIALADQDIIVPMMGMVQSLNVSVAKVH